MTIRFFVFDLSGNAVAMIKNNQTFHVVNPDHLSGSGEAFVCDTNGQNWANLQTPITSTGSRVVAEGMAR